MGRDIFVVGSDRADDSTFRGITSFKNVQGISYRELINGRDVISDKASILLCFPYEIWSEFVENHQGLYGMREFGAGISNLAETVTNALDTRFPNAQYVNHPMSILLERDKKKAKQIVTNSSISVPEDVAQNTDAVLEVAHSGVPVYIKARFGSMGKGITYVSRDKWTTNFAYDGRDITNHPGDYAWSEINITGDRNFLERILEEDVVVEKAVLNPRIDGTKFDMRGTVLFGAAYPSFSCGRVTTTSSITNVSQGAVELTLEEMKNEGHLNEAQISAGLDVVERSAAAFGLNYAGGDILFEGENYKPVFLELNSFPGPTNEAELFPKLYKLLVEKLGS